MEGVAGESGASFGNEQPTRLIVNRYWWWCQTNPFNPLQVRHQKSDIKNKFDCAIKGENSIKILPFVISGVTAKMNLLAASKAESIMKIKTSSLCCDFFARARVCSPKGNQRLCLPLDMTWNNTLHNKSGQSWIAFIINFETCPFSSLRSMRYILIMI